MKRTPAPATRRPGSPEISGHPPAKRRLIPLSMAQTRTSSLEQSHTHHRPGPPRPATEFIEQGATVPVRRAAGGGEAVGGGLELHDLLVEVLVVRVVAERGLQGGELLVR